MAQQKTHDGYSAVAGSPWGSGLASGQFFGCGLIEQPDNFAVARRDYLRGELIAIAGPLQRVLYGIGFALTGDEKDDPLGIV